jgi:hypothetical protein
MNLQDLFENRSFPLYHGTSIFKASEIIKQNAILSATTHTRHPVFGKENAVNGVSLTRSSIVAHRFGPVVFVLDQSKLRQKYRIEPMDYWHYEAGDNRRQYNYEEQEEFLVGTIAPLSRYLTAILYDSKSGRLANIPDMIVNHPLARPVKRDEWNSIGMLFAA